MTHLDAATARALSDPDTARSFATLDKHRPLDRTAALRLLRRNARDATPFTPASVRDAVAERLLAAYMAR